MEAFLWIVILFFYLLPAIIANTRKHYKTWTICALNIAIGWTMIGWLVCLIWAFTTPVDPFTTNRTKP